MNQAKRKIFKINSAFTLAETLIVIGIIGVVAALTLPNLNHATGDKERVTRVKKIYSALNDAYERAQVVYGDADSWYYTMTTKNSELNSDDVNNMFTDRISEFMKVSKELYPWDNLKVIKLADGTEFYSMNTDCLPNPSVHYDGQMFIGNIDIDLDGYDKGKNENGYDQFRFEILSQGIYPETTAGDSLSYIFQNYGGQSKWILEFGNLDYLKVDEEGNCNDSNIVLDGTTNTSCH